MSGLYLPLAERARYVRELPLLLYGDAHHIANGLAAVQYRSRLDTANAQDGDPATCDGWSNLTDAERDALAADYADWQGRQTRGLGLVRGAA